MAAAQIELERCSLLGDCTQTRELRQPLLANRVYTESDIIAAKKYKTGVTRDAVVATALELTRQHGLYGWSVRDLVRTLGTATSVVYTKVGGKDALCEAVVEHIFTTRELIVTDDTLSWQEWFSRTLLTLRDELVHYPGVAKWLTLHGGPTFPGVVERLHHGLEKLHAAGFGDNSVSVFAALMTTAMNTITMSDERLSHEDDGPRDHSHIVDRLSRAGDESTAVQGFREFSEGFAGRPEESDARRREYFTLVITTMITGFAHQGDGMRTNRPN
ncbi:TetR family transcriptional regulator [Micromonospora sp. Llam0]|uniref:TetR/AcrR family transcriptional regulator n=1 Tax=Micromonospora sp. Llam0 TaxID=2485143 RepID=UPI000F4A75D4|nr:TetR family transcriptional regulator [Micromonospora sp. Llam0]ROO60459.1 TetR family transcriptional regulator [Micromonospora sp. Llam0]